MLKLIINERTTYHLYRTFGYTVPVRTEAKCSSTTESFTDRKAGL